VLLTLDCRCRWAFDMDYSCFAVPAEVGYRYPESGAGAVMSRPANRTDSFSFGPRSASAVGRARKTRPETEQETKELSMVSPELRPPNSVS